MFYSFVREEGLDSLVVSVGEYPTILLAKVNFTFYNGEMVSWTNDMWRIKLLCLAPLVENLVIFKSIKVALASWQVVDKGWFIKIHVTDD